MENEKKASHKRLQPEEMTPHVIAALVNTVRPGRFLHPDQLVPKVCEYLGIPDEWAWGSTGQKINWGDPTEPFEELSCLMQDIRIVILNLCEKDWIETENYDIGSSYDEVFGIDTGEFQYTVELEDYAIEQGFVNDDPEWSYGFMKSEPLKKRGRPKKNKEETSTVKPKEEKKTTEAVVPDEMTHKRLSRKELIPHVSVALLEEEEPETNYRDLTFRVCQLVGVPNEWAWGKHDKKTSYLARQISFSLLSMEKEGMAKKGKGRGMWSLTSTGSTYAKAEKVKNAFDQSPLLADLPEDERTPKRGRPKKGMSYTKKPAPLRTKKGTHKEEVNLQLKVPQKEQVPYIPVQEEPKVTPTQEVEVPVQEETIPRKEVSIQVPQAEEVTSTEVTQEVEIPSKEEEPRGTDLTDEFLLSLVIEQTSCFGIRYSPRSSYCQEKCPKEVKTRCLAAMFLTIQQEVQEAKGIEVELEKTQTCEMCETQMEQKAYVYKGQVLCESCCENKKNEDRPKKNVSFFKRTKKVDFMKVGDSDSAFVCPCCSEVIPKGSDIYYNMETGESACASCVEEVFGE